MRFPGFIGPSYTLKSVNVDCQRCINLYPEFNELGRGKEGEVAALIGTPGLTLLTTIGVGPIRGEYVASNGQFFVVSANKLYRVSTSWVATELGTLNSTEGPVSMADNGLHLVTVDGEDGYVWTFASSLFAEITDPDFQGADQVTFQDGYFIFNKPNSGQFYISGLNAVTFDALDIATSEGNPDYIVGLISVARDLWIFNAQTCEVFSNTGNADFPFERSSGQFIEVGCSAAFSIAKMNNSVYWVGKDKSGGGVVYTARGIQPQRVSTTAVETAIKQYDLTTAEAWSYQENGHFFYCLNFEDATTTWVYDATTGMWHERAYSNQGQFERHRANCHAYFNNKHVVGDYVNGKLYELSADVYSDNGTEIISRRIAPHLTSGLKNVFYDSFQLDMEAGTGLDGVGQGTDPQVMMRFSDDGGHSWSNEKWVAFGKIGQRLKRAIWRRLGFSRDRVYEISISDPVKRVLIGAELGVQNGES